MAVTAVQYFYNDNANSPLCVVEFQQKEIDSLIVVEQRLALLSLAGSGHAGL